MEKPSRKEEEILSFIHVKKMKYPHPLEMSMKKARKVYISRIQFFRWRIKEMKPLILNMLNQETFFRFELLCFSAREKGKRARACKCPCYANRGSASLFAIAIAIGTQRSDSVREAHTLCAALYVYVPSARNKNYRNANSNVKQEAAKLLISRGNFLRATTMRPDGEAIRRACLHACKRGLLPSVFRPMIYARGTIVPHANVPGPGESFPTSSD